MTAVIFTTTLVTARAVQLLDQLLVAHPGDVVDGGGPPPPTRAAGNIGAGSCASGGLGEPARWRVGPPERQNAVSADC
ncbi:hypothetical protein ACGF07_31925 [Kitasatospora sp. NPDC048194]|uniref:hypothetical protein n=1 Tax=Kitasatospora sp. NPDC048194 TaxID=3364045 RepID=UPI0037180869